jgi:hypothetical protein
MAVPWPDSGSSHDPPALLAKPAFIHEKQQRFVITGKEGLSLKYGDGSWKYGNMGTVLIFMEIWGRFLYSYLRTVTYKLFSRQSSPKKRKKPLHQHLLLTKRLFDALCKASRPLPCFHTHNSLRTSAEAARPTRLCKRPSINADYNPSPHPKSKHSCPPAPPKTKQGGLIGRLSLSFNFSREKNATPPCPPLLPPRTARRRFPARW